MKRESFHRIHHTGWLRAAVMGANDGIVSTASLVVGVAAAHAAYPDAPPKPARATPPSGDSKLPGGVSGQRA